MTPVVTRTGGESGARAFGAVAAAGPAGAVASASLAWVAGGAAAGPWGGLVLDWPAGGGAAGALGEAQPRTSASPSSGPTPRIAQVRRAIALINTTSLASQARSGGRAARSLSNAHEARPRRPSDQSNHWPRSFSSRGSAGRRWSS